MATPRPQLSYFRVSKTADITASASKFRDLRLVALQSEPLSFASTYGTKLAFSNDQWLFHVQDPQREVFVCVVHDETASEGLRWVAQVRFWGPLTSEEFAIPALPASGKAGVPESESTIPSTSAEAEEEEKERWQMLGLFTLESFRDQGIAKTLCQKALDYLTLAQIQLGPSAGAGFLQVCAMMKPGLHDNMRLYRQLGFVDAGRCTLAEALSANGDRALLPRGWEVLEGYTAWTSYVMMRISSR